ncbi:fimbrial biogenesis chaperone [Enterobacter bugandensis]|uniref:fimbrial biogenesis chaperone n=1 Tax=Enterobacter bugandensis TaxID=881260 RepID=UPI000B4A0FB0|nr:molecular chaperone [Enterobacter bugandensis]QWZ48826.1 molecular chaperone [Enterobacter bugandensis]UBH41102.1 molecular chaperone [Enterobacter bugandensis]UBH92799.1 molecular chaperone [Enterobacter bugandensis]UBH99413.1 molecular chaperone [Enterobacter bugandensis]
MVNSCRNIVFSVLALSMLAITSTAEASLTFGGTRFVYHASEDSTTVNVYNKDKGPYLLQSWVSDFSVKAVLDKDTADKKHDVPFVVTPPLFKMDAGDTSKISIIAENTATLPQDRESVFYLNFKAIPGKAENQHSSLLISVKSSMKLFWRPQQIDTPEAANAWKKIEITQSGNQVSITNPTPYYITFYSLNADGTKLNTPENSMVAPFGKLTYVHTGRVHSFTWTALGDFGQITPENSITL